MDPKDIAARLTSDEGRALFVETFVSAVDWALDRPLGEIVDSASLFAALDAATSDEASETARDAGNRAHLEVLRSLRLEKSKLGKYVPETAKKKIAELAKNPKPPNPKLVRALIEQDAMEETLRDVMFDGLKEFNVKVNPFVADWGLPGILKKLGPFGFGPLAKSLDSVRAEFDKRLDPEIRKFLAGFSKRALRKMADLMSERTSDPKFAPARMGIVEWFYDQEIRELVADADDERARTISAIASDIIKHTLRETADQRKTTIQDFIAAHANEPVRKVLADVGITKIDVRPLAEAVWPYARTIMQSPAFLRAIENTLK